LICATRLTRSWTWSTPQKQMPYGNSWTALCLKCLSPMRQGLSKLSAHTIISRRPNSVVLILLCPSDQQGKKKNIGPIIWNDRMITSLPPLNFNKNYKQERNLAKFVQIVSLQRDIKIRSMVRKIWWNCSNW
jgi:hypothetical protein